MTIAEPITRRWTRAEYYRLAEEGWFTGQRVQLIAGEILQSPRPSHAHSRTLHIAMCALTGIFPPLRVRPQLPLNVPGESDPEPDLAIAQRSIEEYNDHPTTAVLVMEIADSSIQLDRRKAGVYALAAVPDYWIVNMNSCKLEVFREPVADAGQEFGHCYAEQFELDETGFISPLTAPNSKINVKTFF